MKKCRKCGEDKDDGEFATRTHHQHGHVYTERTCRTCVAASKRVYAARALSGIKVVKDLNNKTCAVCLTLKPISEFRKWLHKKYNVTCTRSVCKLCDRIRAKQKKKELGDKHGMSGGMAIRMLYPKVHFSELFREIKRRCGKGRKKNGTFGPTHPKPCTITSQYLYDMWLSQGGKCALTGIDMVRWETDPNTRDFHMSADCIEQKLGYVPGNVRLICYRVNTMRGNMTDDETFAWCRRILGQH